jgi:drug/metabolite transporter superfamily protein YnfA
MHLAGCGRFWLWAAAGAAVAFALVAAASIGLLVLPLAIIVTVLAANSTRRRIEALGGLVGAAIICFLIAWIQQGPGGFDSRPWFAAGVVLAAAGVAGYAVLARRLAPPA